jgi:hypothetical protein
MCFSASASFAVGAALLPAGVYCTRTAVRKGRGYLPLAAVPFAFSSHQFCEGLVWLGLGREDAALVEAGSVAYLFLAIAFWPFWIPFSIFCCETRPGVKRLLGILAVLGLAFTWLFWPIAEEPGRWLTTEVVHHSIRYDFYGIPGFTLFSPAAWRFGYLVLVAVPLVLGCVGGKLTGKGRIAGLAGGLALGASFVVSYFFFWYAFTSVWCFFAALLAGLLCVVFSRLPDAPSAQFV